MLNQVRFAFVFWLIIIIKGCSPVPESEYYETEGIVSISAENGDFDNDWKKSSYSPSGPLQLNTSGRSVTTFQFYLQSTGLYSLWILSAMPGEFIPDNNIRVTVNSEDGFLQYQGVIEPDYTSHIVWSRLKDESDFIEFEQPGFYEVVFEFNGHSGFLFQKLHLTKNNADPPSGFGLPETKEPDLDPVLIKRLQPVMIPPAWAFGLMVWAENNGEDVIDSLLAEDIRVDAVINRPESTQSKIEQPATWRDQEHIFSVNIVDSSGENLIRDELAFSEKRPFMLLGMQNLDDPDFKKLPAKWAKFTNEDSTEQSIAEVLKQRIEMISNPRLASSEPPFLSSGMDHLMIKTFDESIPEEFLLRWIQFSALTGMMHLYVPPNSSSELFSANVMQEIRKMTQLRSRLFPYLYSLAHLVRARAENPVRGDGEHTTQFQLGEAFLVAPVYREGNDSRTTWFPEGTWYDYWSGERIEGGQTWLVDAPIRQIPLFVKAGSIIPYRSEAGQIMTGSNHNLTIEIYAGGVGTFRLYEDDGTTNRYRSGKLATTGFRYFETAEYATFTIGKTVGEYEGLPKERSIVLEFLNIPKPSQVSANSKMLRTGSENEEWVYDVDNQTLIIQWNQPTDLKTDFKIRF